MSVSVSEFARHSLPKNVPASGSIPREWIGVSAPIHDALIHTDLNERVPPGAGVGAGVGVGLGEGDGVGEGVGVGVGDGVGDGAGSDVASTR